jgi:hypothetical protein
VVRFRRLDDGARLLSPRREIWKIGDDKLIAESQDSFDVTEYQRQLERGVEDAR